MSGGTADRAERPISFTAPFRHPAFTVIWTATLVSNVGGWMYSAASGWLMTLLDADPLMVARRRRAVCRSVYSQFRPAR